MYLFGIMCLFIACSTSGDDTNQTQHLAVLTPGHWVFTFDLNGAEVVQHATLDDSLRFTLHNHTENILLSPTALKGDSLYIEIPVYNTYFQGMRIDQETIRGSWHNPDKSSDYTVDFIAQYTEKQRNIPINVEQQLIYAVRFSPDSTSEYPAVGKFAQTGSYLSGTFLTETGDYRFLAGEISGDALSLQCFDGSHLFHFSMQRKGESLEGVFRSGIHWQEPFAGTLDSTAQLRNPFEIITLSKDTLFEFHALKLDGEMTTFTTKNFLDKVTIVEIFGSWCPNCLDQARYLKSLEARYSSDQLQLIGVAFERSADFETTVSRLQRYQSEIGLNFPLYIGGNASKSEAAKVFHMLSCICSFPTTLVIDQTGSVSLIHTGFNGPSTGRPYEYFKTTFEAHLDSLLQSPQLTLR